MMGCVPILKKINGITQPKPVSIPYLIDFAHKNGIGGDNLVFLSYERAEEIYSKRGFTMQTARVFDSQGFNIPIDFTADSTTCESHAILLLIQNIRNLDDYPRSDSITLASHLAGLVDKNENPFSIKNLKTADFYVTGDWASYLGKINRNRFSLEEEYLKNSGLSISYIKINYDIRKEWGTERLAELGFK